MSATETHKVILDINGKDARQELERQKQLVETIAKSMEDIAKSRGTMDAEYKALEKRLNQAQRAMEKYKASTVELDRVLKNLDTASIKKLETANAALTAQMKSGDIERGSAQWKQLLETLSPIRQELTNVKAETEATMATVKNIGDMSVTELNKANRAMQALLATQEQNTARWKNIGEEIQKIQRELDAATAAQKRLIAGANEAPFGKSISELNRMKSALEQTLTTQRKGTDEWINTNLQLKRVNEELRYAELAQKQASSNAFGLVNGKSKDELVKMKQALQETLNVQRQGSDEWLETLKRIERVSAAIDKVELETKKASKHAIVDPKGLPIADLKKMESTLNDIIKREKQGTDEWQRATNKLKEVKDEMYRLDVESKRAAVDVNKVLNNLSSANADQLRKTLEVLNKELNSPNIKRGSDEWKRYNEQLKQVAAELKLVESEGKETKSWIDRFNDGMNNWQTTIAAAAAAIFGLYNQLIEMRNFSFAKEDAASKLQAITGLDDKSIYWLRDRARELSTEMDETGMRVRQSTADIMDAFRLVGSNKPELLKDREGLYEVTKEVIRLAQAANMELQPTVLSLTTALNQFGQGADAARKYVNALAAGSKYGAADVENQAKVIVRSGVAANLAKVSFEDLVAATETLAETGLKGERAGTSMKTVFTRMELGAKNCRPSIVGLDKALENMASKADDIEWLKKTFGLWSYSAAKTLIDHRESLKRYRKAVTDTTVAEEQAAIMGKNDVAIHTQLVNKFKELSDDLYEMVGPSILHVTSKMVNWTRTIKEITKWMIENKEVLAVLVTQLTIATIALNRHVIEQKAVHLWNKYIVGSCKAVVNGFKNIKASGGIWIAIANLVVAAGVALTSYLAKMKHVETETERLERIQNKYNEALESGYSNTAKRQVLINQLNSENVSLDVKEKILRKLNREIPEFNGNIDKTTGKLKANMAALDELSKKEVNVAVYKKFAGEMAEILAERAKLTKQRNDAAKEEWDAYLRLQGGQESTTFSSSAGTYTVKSGAKLDHEDALEKVNEFNRLLDENEARLKEYESFIGDALKNISDMEGLFTIDAEHDTEMANLRHQAEELKKSQIAEAVRKEKEDARREAEEAKLQLAEQLDAGLIEMETYEEETYKIDLNLFQKYIDICKKWYTVDSSNYKDAVNDKIKFRREHLEKKHKMDEKERKDEEAEENKEIRDKLRAIDAETKALKAAALARKNASLASGTSKESADITYNQEVFEIEQKAFDKKMALYSEENSKYKKLQGDKQLAAEEYMNKLQEKTVDIQNKLFAKQSSQYQAEIDLLNEALNKKLISEQAYVDAVILLRRKQNDAEYKEIHQQNATLKLNMKERTQNINDAYQKQLEKEKQLLERGMITQEQYAKEIKDLRIKKNKETYVEYQNALNEWLGKYKVIISQLQNTLSTYTSMINAEYEAQISEVENRYDLEIHAAEKAGKNTKKIEAEKARAVADIQLKQIKAQHDTDVAQALINVAMSITEGFAQYGPIVGAVLAALSTAMGAMQIATLNTQYQAQKKALNAKKALNDGYYSGGYTNGRRYRKEAGVVHEGEFVANHEAVNNPALRPMFDLIDEAQKKNRVAKLTPEDLAMSNAYRTRGFAQGGYTSPVVNVAPATVNVMNQEELITVIKMLNKKLEEGIYSYTTIDGPDGIDRKQKRFNQLKSNKSR